MSKIEDDVSYLRQWTAMLDKQIDEIKEQLQDHEILVETGRSEWSISVRLESAKYERKDKTKYGIYTQSKTQN